MENIILFAIFTTVFFILLKVVEMKYLDAELKPLKVIIRDAVIVFVSALGAATGFFYFKGTFSDFINVVTENKVVNLDATEIFTGEPGF